VNPDPNLTTAYLSARYSVEVGPRRSLEIRCGERSAEVDRLLERHGFQHWAFVTACNPRSRRLDDDENAARMRRLRATLETAGHVILPGLGAARDGSWPEEQSLLVLGMPEAEAVRLGADFGQHAIVVGRRGEPARLVWIPGPREPA
jgi:hypothetical protein